MLFNCLNIVYIFSSSVIVSISFKASLANKDVMSFTLGLPPKIALRGVIFRLER